MVDQNVNPEILAQSPLFGCLRKEDREVLALLMRVKKLKPHQALFHAGEPGNSLGLVVEGELGVGVGEDEVVIGPLEVIGEMTCLDPAPRSATVVARSEAVVWTLDRNTLTMVRATAPGMYTAIVQAISLRITKRLRATNEAIRARYPDAESAGKAEKLPEATNFNGEIDLRKLHCLWDFSVNELALLASAVRYRRYAEGAVMCRQGDASDRAFIVVEGEVEVRQRVGERNCVLGSVEAGDLVGHAGLLDGGPRSATLVTRTETVTAEIDLETFQTWRNSSVPMAVRFQEAVAVAAIRELRHANERLGQIPHHTPRPNGETGADVAKASPFARKDTVARFYESVLAERGISEDELDSLELN